MKIIIDLMHPAHFNFFKKSIAILQEKGHEVIITVLNRGKLPKIVEKEILNQKIYFIGKHRGTFLSVIFEANIFRFLKMLIVCLKEKPLKKQLGAFFKALKFLNI